MIVFPCSVNRGFSPLTHSKNICVLHFESLRGLKSFLLSMCFEAPESTTDSRSSGDFQVGADIARASIGK